MVFTALHGMQTRSSDEHSVCLSVRLSVRRSVRGVNCDKTEEKSVQIFSLVFSEKEWLVGGDTFYLKFWVNQPPRARVQPRGGEKSHFCWEEEGAAWGIFYRVRRMKTKKVRQHFRQEQSATPAKILATPMVCGKVFTKVRLAAFTYSC